jgi:hypothetical protein
MEQMINQMNQMSFHLVQPKANKNKNLEEDWSTIQCYKCQEMGHYSKKCPNLLTRENVSFFT